MKHSHMRGWLLTLGLLAGVLALYYFAHTTLPRIASIPTPLPKEFVPRQAALLERTRDQYIILAAKVDALPAAKASDVANLRQRLFLLGDLKFNPPEAQWDDALTAAIKSFQTRHGITADGKLGKATLAAMNVPMSQRIAQLERASMHMRQWWALQPPTSPHRRIIVNIPAYTLYGIENNQVIFTSRVIVGDLENHTPRFDREINAIQFFPKWNVPQRIAEEELLKKEAEEPGYLENSGFSLISRANGEIVDPKEIGWESVSTGEYRIRQQEGAGNALGNIKFNLPDSDAIYLHSTSRPSLFAKDYRALSHGCVRVQSARELAQFVLQPLGWSEEKVNKAYDGHQSFAVEVKPAPALSIVYWTAWMDETSGLPQFWNDVYELASAE